MIRYRGGLQFRTAGTDTLRATLAAAAILTVSGAMGGVLLLTSQARVKLRLPVNVEESVDDDLPILTKTVWKLGDPAFRPHSRKASRSIEISDSPIERAVPILVSHAAESEHVRRGRWTA